MHYSLIDTHAHLNFNAFTDDAKEVIQSCLDEGIGVINVGSQFSTSTRAVELAQEFDEGVWAAVGKHPVHVDDEGFDTHGYEHLIERGKVVAIGETGLDAYRIGADEKAAYLARQKDLFAAHVGLSKQFDLPMIVHGRGSKEDPGKIYEELLQLLQALGVRRAVIHCYGGTQAMAKQFIDAGYYISFTGIVTFKNAKEIAATAKTIPLDRLMVETDSPYLSPEPVRGHARNTPINVAHVADFIARLRDMDEQEFRKRMVANARAFFSL